MNKNTMSESSSTKAISNLVKKVRASSQLKDSMFEEAAGFFAQLPEIKKKSATLEQNLATAQLHLSENTKKNDAEKLKKKLDHCRKQVKDYEAELAERRLTRLHKLKSICDEILSLCIGQNMDATNRKYAKLLGTLALRAPDRENATLQYNQQGQHLYQAVLSLKLLDQLLDDRRINNEYILERSLQNKNDENSPFRSEVQIPLLITALLQGVGNCHPDAQKILKGETGDQDEFRLLEKNERLELLKCTYQQDLNYLIDGLGVDKYVGHSRIERDLFNQKEEEKLAFIRILLKSAVNPKQGIGNLTKIPQIYTSVALSTKRNSSYASLPRVFLMLNKGVEKNVLSKAVVDSLLKITGVFPQGFGIAYIPKNPDGFDLDRYEYAIVNTLYPKDAQNPICRIATKNLVFTSSGPDLCIGPDNNLHYPAARKKLEKINPERLKEILSQLWNNFEVRQKQVDLIPKCWHPHEYFSCARQQNIWNKAG